MKLDKDAASGQIARYVNCIFDVDDLVEIRQVPSGASSWCKASALINEIPSLWSKNQDGQNIYIGANPRKKPGERGDANVAKFNSVFVDFDGASWAVIQELLSDAGLSPYTMAIQSGHGVHIYWRLTQDVTEETWREYMRGAIAKLGSDPVIKNPERIMRLPGFLNVKSEPFVPAYIIEDHAGLAYDIDDIGFDPIKYTPPPDMSVADGEKLEPHPATLKFIDHGARAGERNAALFNAACDLRGRLWPEDVATAVLVKAAVASGLSAAEAETCIESAFKKERMPRADDDDDMPIKSVLDRLVVGTAKEHQKAADEDRRFRPILTNVITKWEKDKPVQFHVPIDTVGEMLQRATREWPRSITGLLFYAEPSVGEDGMPSTSSARFLTDKDDLFAWIGERCLIRWGDNRGRSIDEETREELTLATKSEFFKHVKACCPKRYKSIELMPHEPLMRGVYYIPHELPAPTGEAMKELIAHLNPETEADRDLMIAAMITPFWGGAPGRRPAFIFTSRYGRGSGKTETAQLFARIAGGAVSVDENEEWEQVKTRLLSDESLQRRIILIDNIKKKLSRSGLESAITAPIIDGRRMYYGQFSRPNNLTWYITANTPALSRDLAQRSIVIRIGQPKHASDFAQWIDYFLINKRQQLISDIMAKLAGPDLSTIEMINADRWLSWGQGVLQKIERANENMQYIIQRRDDVDVDLTDVGAIIELIKDLCDKTGQHDVHTAKLLISKRDFLNALKECDLIDERMTVRGCTGLMRTLGDVGFMIHLKDHGAAKINNKAVQAWRWEGAQAPDGLQPIKFDPDHHTTSPLDALADLYNQSDQGDRDDRDDRDDQDQEPDPNDGIVDDIPF